MDDPKLNITSEYKPMHPAVPEEIPRPSIWPIALALGTTFLGWGLISILAISVVGLVLMGLAIAGWVSEFLP